MVRGGGDSPRQCIVSDFFYANRGAQVANCLLCTHIRFLRFRILYTHKSTVHRKTSKINRFNRHFLPSQIVHHPEIAVKLYTRSKSALVPIIISLELYCLPWTLAFSVCVCILYICFDSKIITRTCSSLVYKLQDKEEGDLEHELYNMAISLVIKIKYRTL